MNTKKEIWKEYPLDFDYENDYKIEVSDHGRVKTYNVLHPEGEIVKGSLQGGFPILRIKLRKPRTKTNVRNLQDLQEKIDVLKQRIKEETKTSQKQILQKEKDALLKKRINLNKKINLKRTINLGILIHKAVAELFLQKPTDSEKKFIIHHDFDKENNHVENLAWASQEELKLRTKLHPKMILHEFKKQFDKKVPNTKASKLEEKDVLYIKKRLKKGDTLKKLAQKFKVSDMQIHRIKTGENWGHIKLIEEILEENK